MSDEEDKAALTTEAIPTGASSRGMTLPSVIVKRMVARARIVVGDFILLGELRLFGSCGLKASGGHSLCGLWVFE